MSSRLTDYRNGFGGQTAVIAACGWSVEEFDWQRLNVCNRNVVLIGVNRIIKAMQPDFWFVSEQSVQFVPYVRYLKRPTIAVVRESEVSDAVIASGRVNCLIYKPHDSKRGNPNRDYMDEKGPFSRGELWTKATVTLGALELARFFGCTRVIMLGCDLCFKPGSDQYYFDSTIEAKRLADKPFRYRSTHLIVNKNLDRMRAWLGSWACYVDQVQPSLDRYTCTPGIVPSEFKHIKLSEFWEMVEC